MSIAIVNLEFLPFEGEKLTQWMPIFEADKRLKDSVKIIEDLANKKQKWIADVGNHTFTTKLNGYCGYIYNGKNKIIFVSSENKEEDIYMSLYDFILSNKIKIILWHNVDKYNLKLHLISLKYNLVKMPLFYEILGMDDKLIQSLTKNISLDNLQKYFNIIIDNNLPPSLKELHLVGQIYERTV